jgi:hypothetical protein
VDSADLEDVRQVVRAELARVGLRPPVPRLGAWTWSDERAEWVELKPQADAVP